MGIPPTDSIPSGEWHQRVLGEILEAKSSKEVARTIARRGFSSKSGCNPIQLISQRPADYRVKALPVIKKRVHARRGTLSGDSTGSVRPGKGSSSWRSLAKERKFEYEP